MRPEAAVVPAPADFPAAGSGAPVFNRLNALTGERAESPVPAMLAAADEISGQAAELEALRDERDELVIRNGELWQTVCDQSAELNALRAQLDRARAERDTYRLAVSK